MQFLHEDITDEVIRAFYKVYNTLGYGFLEKVYERAMMIELDKFNLKCQSQYPVPVFYGHEKIGDYFADIVVEDKIIVELKAASNLCEEHEAQLLNYLKATDFEVGLLLNFGKEPQIRRKIFTNERKKR